MLPPMLWADDPRGFGAAIAPSSKRVQGSRKNSRGTSTLPEGRSLRPKPRQSGATSGQSRLNAVSDHELKGNRRYPASRAGEIPAGSDSDGVRPPKGQSEYRVPATAPCHAAAAAARGMSSWVSISGSAAAGHFRQGWERFLGSVPGLVPVTFRRIGGRFGLGRWVVWAWGPDSFT